MILENGGLNYGNSLYMPIKLFLYNFPSVNIFSNLFFEISPYFVSIFFSLPFLGLFIYQMRNKKYNVNLNLLEFISVCFILFTPVSADYYLLILFIPILIIPFELFSLEKLLLYIFILLPKVIIIKGITLSSFANPVLLLILLLLIIFQNDAFINEGPTQILNKSEV